MKNSKTDRFLSQVGGGPGAEGLHAPGRAVAIQELHLRRRGRGAVRMVWALTGAAAGGRFRLLES